MTAREQLEVVLFFSLVTAMVLAALVAPLLLAAYRRSLRRHMRAVGQPQLPPPPAPLSALPPPYPPSQINPVGGVLNLVPVDHPTRPDKPTVARRYRRISALIYLAGGLIFGLIAAPLVIIGGGIELLGLRTMAVALAFSSPNLIVMAVIFGLRSKAAGFTAALYGVGFIILGVTSGFAGDPELYAFAAPFQIWVFFGAPSLPLLVLLSRRLRAVTPVIVFVVGLAVGGAVLLLGLLNYDPVTSIAVEVAVRLDIGALSVFVFFACLGFFLFGSIGWLIARRPESDIGRRFLSTEGVIIDVVWVVQGFVVSIFLREANPAGAVLPLIAYKAVTTLGLIQLRHSLARYPLQRLLLLRVFGDRDRSSRLLDDLRNYWSYLGTIGLISAPDLASHVIDHRTVLKFVSGRLRNLFLRDGNDLQRRLREIDDERQSDGRFGLEPLYCQGDIWRQAVQSLMATAQLVVMDLRGYDQSKEGCTFEIERLLDLVPTGRIVLLVDNATDVAFLNTVLFTKWARLDSSSVNYTTGQSQLIRLAADPSEASPTDWLISNAGHR